MQAEDEEVSSEVSMALVSAAAAGTTEQHGQRREAVYFNFSFKHGSACDADGNLEPPRRRLAKRQRGRVSPPAGGCAGMRTRTQVLS
jgi:hypothetical protein